MNPVITALPVRERTDMADNVPTGRELEALKVLWTRGKATVREIYQEMKPRDGDGELAYTTVLSLLQTMEQKGLVDHESAGKAYVYCPLVQRENTFRKLAGGFLDQVFDGALAEYVARALQSRHPSLKELEELERMIGEAKKKARSPNKSK
jgi:BlaI family transcriptional regulator, penicillinase repressor